MLRLSDNPLSRRLEWLFEDDDAATPTSGPRPRGGLVDGRYELLERLGAGAMGIVYLADDIWLGRRVAIKVLKPADEADPSRAELLRQEARALAKVRDENIVQVYALGPHGGSFYIAMEYVAGGSVESLIARGLRTDIGEAIAIIEAIGSGLGALHARGLVHRDVKPSNILLEEGTGRPVLVDFGLAAALRERSIAGGTPAYVAPEQAMDDRAAIGPATDLYSLACTAFELLTGRTPFDAPDKMAMLLAHLRKEPPPVSSARSSLAPFDAAFRRALAKSPSDRQPSCPHFVAELRAAYDRMGRRAPMVTAPPPPQVATVRPLRVIVLEADDALRRQIVRIIDRTLRATGEDVEIEYVLSATELGAACMREPPQIVVIDEDTTNGVTEGLVRALGERVGEVDGAPEVLVLRRSLGSPPSEPSSIVELAKPLNAQVLASVLSKIAARVVDRRARAL